ncbi:MAG TPA: hypothetical protein VJX74_03630 [Blastocatellia bacterium]|nr:hypothetical protein [Blastocatellia bacterium]
MKYFPNLALSKGVMMSSNKKTYNDQLLTSYLLGSLPEAETESLDELSITDDEFAGRLQVVENDLVDAYVRGELSGRVLEQFKSFYLLSPKRREKVRLAETFLAFDQRAVTAQAKDARTVLSQNSESNKETPKGPSAWRFFAVPRPALQWGLAVASLLILLAAGYLLVDNLRLRNQMNQAQAQARELKQREQELQDQLSQQRSADAETAKELERVRAQLAQVEQLIAANQQYAKEQSSSIKGNIVSFDLRPQTRGIGQVPIITVPEGTDHIALRLELEANNFPEYEVALKNSATNQITWQSGKLKTRPAGKLSISLPARLLQPQNYTLEVTGKAQGGAAEFISSYPFRVVIH